MKKLGLILGFLVMSLLTFAQTNWTSYYTLMLKDSLALDSAMFVMQTDVNQGVILFTSMDSALFTSPVIYTGFSIGNASINEAELEIIDGATTTTTQLNYLNAATGTTGTTSTNLVFSTSPTLVTPALGTPSSVNLSNGTSLPISTGVSGLAANIATWLATSSSANLASAVTDETGTGVLVFGTSPTFTTSITIGSASIDETELEILDGATLSTTELNYVDGVTSAIQTSLNNKADSLKAVYSDVSPAATKIWLIDDTITLSTPMILDTLYTDRAIPFQELEGNSDSIYLVSLVSRCKGTDIDFTISVFADDTLGSSHPSDTIIAAWNIVDESGDATVQTSLNSNIVPKDLVMYYVVTAQPTAPILFMLSAIGKRYNRTR